MIENSQSDEISDMNSNQNLNSIGIMNRSDVNKRLKKISKQMNILAKGEKQKDSEEIDWDEKVGDDDIRYIIACDMAADMLKEEYQSKTKPEFIKYEPFIPILDALKTSFLGLAIMFLFLGRPDWCVQKGTAINFDCTRSLDPDQPVTYETSGLPVLSDQTKMIVSLLAMIFCNVSTIIKINMTLSGTLIRQSFMFSFFLNILYVIVYLIDCFLNFQVPMSDLIVVIFLIFNILKIQKIFLRAFKIIQMAKSIIFFFLMFGLMMGVICRVMFYQEDDYFDDDTSPFYGFNYTSFGKSLWTGILTGLGGNGTYDGILRYYETSLIKMVFWICIFLLFTLLISNFLVGSLYSYYQQLFQVQVNFIEKHPKLKIMIKELIGKQTLTAQNLQQSISFYVKQGQIDKELVHIENFFSDTADPILEIQHSTNSDSISAFLFKQFKRKNYKIAIGAFEGLCIFFVVLSLDLDPSYLIYTYKVIFFFQICLVIEQYSRIMTKEIKTEDWPLFADILLSIITCCYICICLIIENELYYISFTTNQSSYKIFIGLFVVVKAYRFYRWVFMKKEINTIVMGTYRSLPFIADILAAIGIFFLIFGTVGISIYGGNINSGSPELYEKIYGEEMDENLMLFNFNDYYHAFLTMFMIMQTGWPGYDKTNTLGMNLHFFHNFFFVGLFFFSNVILQNILIGFLCDNTGASMAALDAERQEKIDAGLDPDKDSDDSSEQNKEEGDEGDDGDGDLKGKLSVKESVKEEELDDFLAYNKPVDDVQDDLEDLENPDENKDKLRQMDTIKNISDPLNEVFNEIKGKN